MAQWLLVSQSLWRIKYASPALQSQISGPLTAGRPSFYPSAAHLFVATSSSSWLLVSGGCFPIKMEFRPRLVVVVAYLLDCPYHPGFDTGCDPCVSRLFGTWWTKCAVNLSFEACTFVLFSPGAGRIPNWTAVSWGTLQALSSSSIMLTSQAKPSLLFIEVVKNQLRLNIPCDLGGGNTWILICFPNA